MKASRIITFILGILMIIAGAFCLFNPAMTYLTLGYAVGLSMIVDAIAGFVLWWEQKKAGESNGWILAGAIFSLIFGIFLTSSAAFQWVVDLTIVYLAASWLIVVGILRIIYAFRVHRLSKELQEESLGRHWWLVLIVGILLVICGIFSLFNPAGLILAIGINIGLDIIIAGVTLIAIAA